MVARKGTSFCMLAAPPDPGFEPCSRASKKLMATSSFLLAFKSYNSHTPPLLQWPTQATRQGDARLRLSEEKPRSELALFLS